MKVLNSMRVIGIAVASLLACMAATCPAFATAGQPIQGTPVGLDHDPQGIVASGATDANGQVSFRDLKPGTYTLVIDGQAFKAPGNGKPPCLEAGVVLTPTDLTPDFSIKAPMCPNAAKQGMRVTFDLPKGGDVRVALRTWISGVGDDANPVKNDTWASGNAAMGDVSTTRMKTAPAGDVNGDGTADIAGVVTNVVRNETGNTVARGKTDATGTVTFSNLKPGSYTLQIDGKSLAAAMDKYSRKAGGPSGIKRQAFAHYEISPMYEGLTTGQPVSGTIPLCTRNCEDTRVAFRVLKGGETVRVSMQAMDTVFDGQGIDGTARR